MDSVYGAMQDKERDNHKNQNGIWPYLMVVLGNLQTTEKSYTSLLFLVPKSFLRKENSLKSAYDSLRMDCKRTEEFQKSTPLDLLVVHLLGQLAQFASARLELMELYVTHTLFTVVVLQTSSMFIFLCYPKL